MSEGGKNLGGQKKPLEIGLIDRKTFLGKEERVSKRGNMLDTGDAPKKKKGRTTGDF